MHLHFWFRVYICVSFLVCWLITCWCKRRIVHRSSIFLYVPLHSVNIGVQVVASLRAMRSNECSGSRSRLQPGSGSRRRIACQCLSPTPAKGSAKRRMLGNQNGDGRELWTSNNQIDGRVQTANIFHGKFSASFCVDGWPRLCGVYLKSIYPHLCACMCLFLFTGCCVGQQHDCFEDVCVFHCFLHLNHFDVFFTKPQETWLHCPRFPVCLVEKWRLWRPNGTSFGRYWGSLGESRFWSSCHLFSFYVGMVII